MSLPEFCVDPRIERAATPSAEWYFDAEALRLENRYVFASTWQLVGHVDQVATAGEYFTVEIGAEPIIVVRGLDDTLCAMSNVCRHRAGPVATGSGKRKGFQCGYHGWTYELDGRLANTPEFDGVEGFERAECRLPQFALATWAGLIFVNLDGTAPPLERFLGEIPQLVSHLDLGRMPLAARKDWFIECNWKVYVDNYLEGYHIPIVHPALNKELDYQKYRTETFEYFSIQHSPIKESAKRLRKAQDGTNEAQFFWVYPNLLLNVYPDNFSTNLIVPLGPERTLTVFEWYFMPTANGGSVVDETVTFSNEVQLEDIQICERVQKNLRSQTYTSGRYSVRRENGVHHFHRLLERYLSEPRLRENLISREQL